MSEDRIVIGDLRANNNIGTATVYKRENDIWRLEVVLRVNDREKGDSLGTAVSIYENTIAVGALFEDSAATGVDGDATNNDADASGAVYIFTNINGNWQQQAYIKASNTDASDRFGNKIKLYDNLLAIGATNEGQFFNWNRWKSIQQ